MATNQAFGSVHGQCRGSRPATTNLSPCPCQLLPPQAPPGLHAQPLSQVAHQALAGLPAERHLLAPLEPAAAPQRLARVPRQLSEIALASRPEAERQRLQLALVNRLVALLHQLAPRVVAAGDQLHPSAVLLREIRAPLVGLGAGFGAGAPQRPLIPLADGAWLVNASSEPCLGRALEAEIPSAAWIDLLWAFIQWSGLRLLMPPCSPPCGRVARRGTSAPWISPPPA